MTKRHNHLSICFCSLAAAVATIAGPAQAADDEQVRGYVWQFGEKDLWNGWSPNIRLQDVNFENECVSFRAEGNDPIISGPLFEWPQATNGQHIEIDIDCTAPGTGELYYTNTTQGKYGGFNGKWFVPVAVPTAGRQIVPVWPFWETLGKIIRLRFDPPGGMQCRLYSIRIVGDEALPGTPFWAFTGGPTSWQPMYAARLKSSPNGLHVQATRSMALIATGVEPFVAERRSILRLEADCPGEHSICFYWADRENSGLWGEPITFPADLSKPIVIDLRQYPEWTGTITNLAIGFGTYGKESLTLRSLSIEENDPKQAFLRLCYFGYASGIARPGRPVEARAIVEHAAGPPLNTTTATLQMDSNASCSKPSLPIAQMAIGDRVELKWEITPKAAGTTQVILAINGQSFTRTLSVDPATGNVASGGYAVPPPKPVKTNYQIGIYYFPGWSPDRMRTWKRQATLPERDSLLGWYEEGSPEVADWHIKWAVENGLSFFVYDWYWRGDHEELSPALNEGFLKARYNNQMKFAVMWANHKPFSNHTREQLLTVTDYWIEHYLRRPNYLTVDGKPYVIFYSPTELMESFGSPARIHEELDAMRQRAKAAGLPGLHIGVVEIPGQIAPATLQKMGFDSFTAYNYIRTGAPIAHSLYRQYLINCKTWWEQARAANALPYIPLMGVGWDGPVWYGPRSERRRGRCTDDFSEGLAQLKAFLDTTGERLAILEAWNEFGEGSYIEPNVEFGFGDLEAIRKVFAQPGNWSTNIGPEDVGLAGEYDLRKKPAGCRGAAKYGQVVELANTNPSVTSGLTLRCWENRLVVDAGEVTLDGKTIECTGDCLIISPAETRKIDLPITLQASKVMNWRGGNRLVVAPDNRWNLLPDSYVPDSLRVVDPDHFESIFLPKRDYTIDNTWGAFAITPDGRLKAGQKIVARYEMSLRRIDALVVNANGQASVIQGTPSATCPEPPPIPENVVHIANIYRPFGATTIEPAQVYPITPIKPDLSPIRDVASLKAVLAKLREGKNVTVVCWGDSVTAGGDASTPANCYVALFEAMLKERFPKANIRVINAGIGGSNTAGRFPDIQKEVLDYHPDLVTLEFVNDMGFPVDQLQKRYPAILERIRKADAALLVMTPHYVMPAWMNLPDGRGPDPRPAVGFLRQFTRDNNVPLADASKRWELLEKIGVPYETLLRNGINHPDDRGHRIFAEELMRFFPVE